MPENRLYRSTSQKMIAGICGGIAEYFHVDPTIVRVAWIVLSVLPLVPGIIIYIIAWIVIPKNPGESSPESPRGGKSPAAFFGFFFITAGTILLLGNLDLLDWGDWWRFSWEYLLPFLLISAGVALLVRPRGQSEPPPVPKKSAKRGTKASPAVLVRSRSDRKIFGVCGGLAAYFDIDPSLIRIAFVFFALWPFGLGLLVYLLMALIIPDETVTPTGSVSTQ